LDLAEFLSQPKRQAKHHLPAVSLFSGAGLSDLGYSQAGFSFLVQSELDAKRATLCAENFPQAISVAGDLSDTWPSVVAAYRNQTPERLHLLSVTPPCQGMSSSNPGRGKASDSRSRDKRNRLLLAAIPIITELEPRVVVVENVVRLLTETIHVGSTPSKVVQVFREALRDYHLFTGIVQMADYGIPQLRKRSIMVAVSRDEPWLTPLVSQNLLPWPRPTHAENPGNGLLPWVSLRTWLSETQYPPLDARCVEAAHDVSDALHFVPSYSGDQYLWVADIPPHSGLNAYLNANCRSCGRTDVPEGAAVCPFCGEPMHNRPYVRENGTYRLIKGFGSSYRRMPPDRPAPTVTTASSHLGSDYKIHPWENRVLSIRECADLQTVPRFYNWDWALNTRHTYLARQVIGEALPPWFSYLHGSILQDLLSQRVPVSELASSK
jgi:DNA (cytosine-5)-methyltransferase 1